MKKYLNPEYTNEVAMSSDVITASIVSIEQDGAVTKIVSRDEETNTYSLELSADISSILSM